MSRSVVGCDSGGECNYYYGVVVVKKRQHKQNPSVIFLGVAILVAIIVGELVFFAQRVSSQPRIILRVTSTFADHHRTAITIGQKRLVVEAVTTPASIEQGLSGRSEIGGDGMLFVFADDRVPSFWMKEMKFNLDFIWLRDGKVVGITRDVPHPNPNTPVNRLPLYKPNGPVDMVLEVPAGSAEQWQIEIGAQLQS